PCGIELLVGEFGEGHSFGGDVGDDDGDPSVAVDVGGAQLCRERAVSFDHHFVRPHGRSPYLTQRQIRGSGCVRLRRVDLQQLSDRAEISDLLLRYSDSLNEADWDTWTSCFTDDARLDYTTTGGVAGSVAEALAWLTPTLSIFEMRIGRIANIRIEFEGA